MFWSINDVQCFSFFLLLFRYSGKFVLVKSFHFIIHCTWLYASIFSVVVRIFVDSICIWRVKPRLTLKLGEKGSSNNMFTLMYICCFIQDFVEIRHRGLEQCAFFCTRSYWHFELEGRRQWQPRVNTKLSLFRCFWSVNWQARKLKNQKFCMVKPARAKRGRISRYWRQNARGWLEMGCRRILFLRYVVFILLFKNNSIAFGFGFVVL